jgi:predicted O-methyltransferase YrrM
VTVRRVHPSHDSEPREAIDRVRRVVARCAREKRAVSRLEGTVHEVFPVAIPVPEGAALRDWVTRERAARTIEIGLGYAVSTLFICEGLLSVGTEVRHVAIDPYQATRFGGCGLQFLDDAGVSGMVEFHAEESQILLPKLLEGGRSFDFAFVDGSHRFERVFLDVIYLGRLLVPGRIVMLDDYQLPAVAKAASFCLRNLGWTLLEVSSSDPLHQWAVLRTPTTPAGRPFDQFVDF